MKIIISSGHGKYVSGAVGVLNEVAQNRRVVARVAELLKSIEVDVVEYHDDISRNPADNLNGIIGFHNSQTRDLDVSVHFNAYIRTDDPRGTEVLYLDDAQMLLAAKVSAEIANAGGFRNRGAKKRTDLGFLLYTNKPAIIIEVCFVDSTTDAMLYQEHFDEICIAIAESLSGKSIGKSPVLAEEPNNELARSERVELSFKVGSNIININGNDAMVETPYVIDGVAFVPARALAEAFGAALEWIPETRGVVMSYQDTEIAMQIDSPDVYIRQKLTLPLKPQLKNEKSMVPIRFVAEAFGADVKYDAATQEVTVIKA